METKEMKLNGAVVLWSLGTDTDAAKVRDELRLIGLEQFAPEPNTPNGALKIALQRALSSRSVDMDALAGKTGYQISQLVNGIENGVPVVNRQKIFCVEWPTDNSASLIFRSPHTGMAISPKGADTIQAIYEQELQHAARHKVARCLTRIVDYLAGVPLRDRGGVYWLSNSKLNVYSKVAEILERNGSGNRVYNIKTVHDVDGVRAICDALSTSVKSELSTIQNEIEYGDLKKRALQSRQQRAQELRSQVADYENILGETLDALKDECADVDAAAITTVLANFGA